MSFRWGARVGRKPVQRPRAHLRLEALEERTLLAVNLSASFAGETNLANFHDADTQIAVGQSKIVELANNSIAILDKSTGSTLSQQTMASFFAPVAPGYLTANFFDQLATYDSQANRYVVGCLYRVAATPEMSNLLF